MSCLPTAPSSDLPDVRQITRRFRNTASLVWPEGPRNRVRLKSNFLSRFNVIWVVQLYRKNISLFTAPKSAASFRRPTPQEGWLEKVTEAGWDAVDAIATQDERRSGGRRSRVVLTPDAGVGLAELILPMTVAKEPAHREAAGALGGRSSLRPCDFIWAGLSSKTRTHRAARSWWWVLRLLAPLFAGRGALAMDCEPLTRPASQRFAGRPLPKKSGTR
jgi:hypothetical protein